MQTGIPGVDALIQSVIYGGVGILVVVIGWGLCMTRKQRRRV